MASGSDFSAAVTFGSLMFAGTLVTTTNLIDAVVYDTDDPDDAGLLVLLNPGEPQLNENNLGDKDNPAQCRFRFVSDGAWSDQDGDYPSAAGACMFDEIQIYDYVTGTVLFYDDVESGGLCVPGVPAAAGDYWHIRDIAAEAWSPMSPNRSCATAATMRTTANTAPSLRA